MRPRRVPEPVGDRGRGERPGDRVRAIKLRIGLESGGNAGTFGQREGGWKLRLAKLRRKLAEMQLDGIIILNPRNRRYISGFTGTSAGLLVTAGRALLFTDFRYTEQATLQAREFEVVQHGGLGMLDAIAKAIKDEGLSRVAFEQDFLVFQGYTFFRDAVGAQTLVPAQGIVEEIRQIKDPEEIELIKRAEAITDQALVETYPLIRPGVTESELAVQLETRMRQLGAEGVGFETIVASGRRSSMPHGVASDKKIQMGDFITFDCGAVYKGYHGDLTRTVVVGEPTSEQRKVYDIVLQSQMAALKGLRAGITGRDGDALARRIIDDAGYGKNFGHGLGHSVGLEIHESPRLSPADNSVLRPGVTITVEPGIYVEGWGGVRIEDLVVITEDGCLNLSSSPKELLVL